MMTVFDKIAGWISPAWGVRRAYARNVLKRYQGAEPNRLNANKKPQNNAADQELMGPFGADRMRAWSRMLVRDNAYAWGVVDTIVSSVVGTGIGLQSAFETPDGDDVELVNERRDKVWQEWSEVCELNGQYTFEEIQAMVQREMVEAGECLIHMVTVPRTWKGIYRPVPLALELIEADRLASDRDTYAITRRDKKRIVRGVELDETGSPIAYWVYPAHPTEPHSFNRTPVRLEAKNVLHLFRRDRVGQTRGISWLAPVVQWLRDMGVYLDNELQASAVAACFTVAIKTDTPAVGLSPPSTSGETVDSSGNLYEYLQPGLIMNLRPHESIESANPGRPNSSSEPWINLMLRGIAVGTGLSYEIVARDFSKTNYSSNRASQLEDRRRFRRWQDYLIRHLCMPVWDRFCDAAAQAGRSEFPTMAELLDSRRYYAAVECMPQSWEWVDPTSEQSASEAAIKNYQSSYAEECGKKNKNWRHVFYQRAKEEKLLKKLGLVSPAAQAAALADAQAANAQVAQTNAAKASGDPTNDESEATGELANASTLQFKRNRKAIELILQELADGKTTEQKARVYLSSIGLKSQTIDALIADALDGSGQLESMEQE